MLPLGTALAYHVVPPPPAFANALPLALNTVAVLTPVPHVSFPDTTPHFPFDDVKVNPEPDAAAVKVAQVPVVYHVPALMMQPVGVEEVVTWRVPLPEKGVPGEVVRGLLPGLVVVLGGEGGVPDLGRYFTPVAGQSDLEPSVDVIVVSGCHEWMDVRVGKRERE